MNESLIRAFVTHNVVFRYAMDVLTSASHGAPVVDHYLISRTALGEMEFDGILFRSGARTLEAVVRNVICLRRGSAL